VRCVCACINCSWLHFYLRSVATPLFDMALHVTFLLTAAAVLYTVVYALSAIPRYLARRRFILANGCKPPQRSYPHRDPVFGIDLMRRRIRSAKEHKSLEFQADLFFNELCTNTFSCNILDQKIIQTIEVGGYHSLSLDCSLLTFRSPKISRLCLVSSSRTIVSDKGMLLSNSLIKSFLTIRIISTD